MTAGWVNRVCEEADALDSKINRLTDFLVSETEQQGLSEQHRDLLQKQVNAMGIYRTILRSRIARIALFGHLESQERDSQNSS